MARRWLQDPDILDELAQDAAGHLKQIRGIGRDLATKDRARWPGPGAWLEAYGHSTRLFYGHTEDADLLSALATQQRRFLRGESKARIERWWSDATSDNPECRQRAAQFARAVADALDPPKPRGQPSDLDSRRVRALYVQRRRLNARYASLLDRFLTPPPPSWLPVVGDEDSGLVTMADPGWASAAALMFIAAFLDASEETIRKHIKKGKPRRGK